MRPADISDLWTLRRIAANPFEVLRFRKNHSPEAELQVRLRDQPPLNLRGGKSDYHMFSRIFLRDEYRLRGLAAGELQCVVDLGGNVGLFAARVAPLAQRVITYEPMEINYTQLLHNVELLGNVTAVCAAATGQPGSVRIYQPIADRLSGVYSAYGGHLLSDEYVEVSAVTLDELFQKHQIERCDLLKLDVEGAEYEILHSASAETWGAIRRLHGEYHDVRPGERETRIDSFSAFLGSKGFRVETVAHRRKPNHGMFFARRLP
ncbi:MAG: FkbM family methyltransferase [Planctomycetota bacterium]